VQDKINEQLQNGTLENIDTIDDDIDSAINLVQQELSNKDLD
jgi:hypothetical protein